ncbi:hypothetical protein GWK41_01045 [Persephonella atlantica]|uniref:Ribbon-helix-helix protein CopG domain-containing protein n=1 Tax=Persephonella atlantica TaxID=2699429 RepID=A0ABS1GFH4_9AQUI|nr:hypothetical protein [Persephonella atlantica]MBK3331648.1 hypothetical protein [Persephonella atlantica]
MKKKTYVFDQETLNNLSQIRDLTGKKETQILKEAIRFYLSYLKDEERILSKNLMLSEKLEKLVEQLSEIVSKIR